MPYADLDDSRIRYEDTGGEGPPVVFAQSRQARGDGFEPQVDSLRDVYRLLVFDERDTDTGGAAERPSAARDEARDIFELLDRLGIERAVLAGRSADAEVSLRAALLHPDRVRALILIDTPELPREDLAERMDELAMPLLLIHGAEDATTSAARATEICRAASDCRGVMTVPGAGQGSHRSHPEVVTPAIRAFLEGLPA